ncbi:MAG: hypothetical protein ACRCVA_31085, partial [Phreatobacter sp.]
GRYGFGAGLDLTVGYRLLNFSAPTEIYAKGSFLNASWSDGLNSNIGMVPFIDGGIRPIITGGAVVGLFGPRSIALDRSQQRLGLDLGVRQTYDLGGFKVTPGVFVAYQTLNQRDMINAAGSDPATMTLRADVNGHYWRIGASLGASLPLMAQISLFTNNSISLDFLSASYAGSQTFTGGVFPPATSTALASDRLSRTTWRANSELGVMSTNGPWTVKMSGILEYIGAVPTVAYPQFIAGSTSVNGVARLTTASQFSVGARAAIGYKF